MTVTGTASPPYVIAAVIARLEAASSLTGVLVQWGLPSTLPQTRERVYLLGTSDYRREPYSGGHILRRESYDMRTLVEVHQIASDPQPVSERLWDLIDAIDLAMLTDRDFTYASYAGELSVVADEINPTSDGWIARALVRLQMARSR